MFVVTIIQNFVNSGKGIRVTCATLITTKVANFSQTVATAQSSNIPQNFIVLFQIYDYCNCTIKYFTF